MITDQQYSELFQIGVYPELQGIHDFITLGSCRTQQDVTKGDLQEEETMNNLENGKTFDGAEFKPVPVKLTDAEVEKLLATKELYVTDADETADEPTPTIH